MKKILAIILALSLLSSGFTAFADIVVDDSNSGTGGFGGNNVEVEDTLDDDELKGPVGTPLYFNDFENCGEFTGSNATAGYFTIADSENSTYGKVARMGGATWKAIQGSANCGKYTWNGVEYTALNEPLEQNTEYILAFDYKSVDANQDYCLSFAPKIPNSVFVHSATDFRYNIPVSSDWTNHSVKFNSSTATSIDVKINTLSSNAVTYIDNYSVYEAAKFTVKGMDVELDVAEGVYADGYLAKGAPLVVTAPEGMSIKSATMGGEAVTVTDGVLSIENVTGDVEVSVVSDLKELKQNNLIKNGNIYLLKGQSMVEFVAKSLTKETYTITDSEGNEKASDGTLRAGDKLSIKVNDTDYEEYVVKYFADGSGGDKYTVSDVIYLIESILSAETPKEEDDINRSGKLTVSDVVSVRNYIMNSYDYLIDAEKLAEEKARIAADAETYGITDQMLASSVTNVGNRSRVANVMKKALRGENITIATIGGSITEGTGISVADGRAEKCWAALMADWWKRMFPGQVTFVNAGISGTSSVFGIHRLEADVLSHDPDLLFIEFAVNDGAQTGSVRSCQEALILKMLERGDAAIQMFFTTVSYNGGGGQSTYAPVGQHYDIPQISPRDAFWGNTFQNADGNTYDFAGLTADNTHPNIMGNAMVAVLTNNYLNSVYEELLNINETPNAIPEETFEDDTPNYMNWTSYDVGLMEEGVASSNGKVTVTDYGCFQKNTDSTSFRSNCDPMYGVKYSSGEIEPMVIDIDNCHVFGIFSHTATNGANVKVEIYKQGTNELIKTDDSVDTNYGGAIRTHKASFESLEGVDVTIKITPIIESDRTTANLRNFYIM